MTIANKTVLITGANRGIGKALVDEALRRGATRVYAGMRGQSVHADSRVTPLTLDITDPAQIAAAVEQVESLDVLVNNAGIALYDDLTDRAAIEHSLAVNLYGPLDVTHAFLPLLTRSHGAIVNALSLAAIAPLPIIPAYSISKAAALSMSQSMRALFAGRGVSVHAVITGPVDTDMNAGLDIPKASPESAARAIFDGVDNGEEEIFPDPLSETIAQAWRDGPAKALELQNAEYVVDRDYTATFTVDQTPAEVFAAVTNVRGWWSEDIVGDTDKLNAVFDYRFQDVHRCKVQITEFVPNERVVWTVLDNYFDFIDDKTEWTGTTITFEIAEKGDKTELHFTHHGLVPEYECYDVCSDGWGTYIKGSLWDLIETGTGKPNVGEAITEGERALAADRSYTKTFTVQQPPDEVFAAVNNVRGWWTGGIDGSTTDVGDEFTYRYEDLHVSKQRVTESVPGRRVVWQVLEGGPTFVGVANEWAGTSIEFDIVDHGDRTELRFTHVGLVPEYECFDACSDAWGGLVTGNLRDLIAVGALTSRS